MIRAGGAVMMQSMPKYIADEINGMFVLDVVHFSDT